MYTFRQHPFTMTEILATIAIIAVLAGITLGTAKYVSRHNMETVTKTTMKQIEIGLETVHNRYGYYPPKETAGDFVLPDKENDTWTDFGNFPKAYVKLFKRSIEMERLYKDEDKTTGKTTVKDAWGKAIRYQCPGTVNKSSFDLVSAGPDDKFDTEDDLANYELE